MSTQSEITKWIKEKLGILLTSALSILLFILLLGLKGCFGLKVCEVNIQPKMVGKEISLNDSKSCKDCKRASLDLEVEVLTNGSSGKFVYFVAVNDRKTEKERERIIKEDTNRYILKIRNIKLSKEQENEIEIRYEVIQGDNLWNMVYRFLYGEDMKVTRSSNNKYVHKCASEVPNMVFVQGGASILMKKEVSVNSFYFDKKEVSYSDFISFIGECGKAYSPRQIGNEFSNYKTISKNENWANYCPAIYVSWKEASCYCESLGKRLPTNNEFLFAAYEGIFTDSVDHMNRYITCENSDESSDKFQCDYPNSSKFLEIENLNCNVYEWCASINNDKYPLAKGIQSFSNKNISDVYDIITTSDSKIREAGFRCAKTQK